ncbi:hypothetical protein AB4Z21_37610, partial [Paenibacillus sp. MCAF20]
PIFFTIIPQNGETHVLMSYLSKDKNRYDFIKEQILQVTEERQKSLISNIIATYVENFFISPTYWGSVPKETQNRFVDIFEQTMGNKPPTIGYFKDFNLFVH